MSFTTTSAGEKRDFDTTGIPAELVELGQLILPGSSQPGIENAFQRAVDSAQHRDRLLKLVQEALAELRLDIKYLLFDLESTRQERDELRARFNDGPDNWQ